MISALESRRQYFKNAGAVSSDHSHIDARAEPLDQPEAVRIYAAARAGRASDVETQWLKHLGDFFA